MRILAFGIVLLFFCSSFLEISGRLNIDIRKFTFCDPNFDYTNKIYVTPYTRDGKQYLNGNATFKIPLDDNIKTNFTLELLVGKTYIHLISFNEKHTCSSMHKYFGEFVYDIERTAQLVPGLCPIPPGRYHIHNYYPKYERITIQNIPFGHIRATAVTTGQHNTVIACLIAEVENHS